MSNGPLPHEPVLSRIGRALRMERGSYSEFAHNPEHDREALAIVAVVTVVANVDVLVGAIGRPSAVTVTGTLIQIGIVALLGIVLWFGLAALSWLLGTRMFGGSARYSAVRRALAYAYLPYSLKALAVVPTGGPWLGLFGTLWSIMLSVEAVRESMSLSTGRAVAVVLIPVVTLVIVILLFFTSFSQA